VSYWRQDPLTHLPTNIGNVVVVVNRNIFICISSFVSVRVMHYVYAREHCFGRIDRLVNSPSTSLRIANQPSKNHPISESIELLGSIRLGGLIIFWLRIGEFPQCQYSLVISLAYHYNVVKGFTLKINLVNFQRTRSPLVERGVYPERNSKD